MPHLIAKHRYNGVSEIDRLGEAKYYEQTSVVGTNSTNIGLLNALGLTLYPIGTTGISYRMTQDPDAGTAQVVNNTIIGEILQGGIYKVTAQAAGMNGGTPETINGTIVGMRQIETLTVVGTTNAAGTLDLYAYSALYGGGSTAMAWTATVGSASTPVTVAGDIFTATGSEWIHDGNTLHTFASPGTTAAIAMTAYRAAANDPILSFGYTDQLALSDGTSANTGSGIAPSTMTAATLIMGTAMRANANFGSFFTVAFPGTTTIEATVRTNAANDSTLGFAFANVSTIGLGSTDSTLGTAGEKIGDGVWFTAAAATLASIAPPSRYFADTPFTQMWAKATENVLLAIRYWGFPSSGSAVCGTL